MTSGIKNKIVTSVYELKYISERGEGMYKGFDLLIKTIRNIIFDEFEYVIYTDQATINKYNLNSVFPQSNVTLKINELNGPFYNEVINPLRLKKVSEGHIWDRIHCVQNYVEVMYNKFDYLLRESENFDGNVVWIDAGLFGTSCGQAWRNYIGEIAHSKLFVDKIFGKVSEHGFFSLKGNSIVMNYEEREKISRLFDINCFIVPGGLFGGKSSLVKEYFSDYQNIIRKMVDMGFYTSDQEVLCVMLSKREQMMFFEHNDWDDLQRGILKIMDLYDETKYTTNERYDVQPVVKQTLPDSNIKDLKNLSFTEVADFFGIDKGSLHESHMYTEIYEKYLCKFRDEIFTMVEIGINDTRFPGKCIEFWDTLFNRVKYYGLDIVDCSHFTYNQEKVKIFKGDQNNPADLNNFVETFQLSNVIDVIIDDGSHVSEHIITSFKTLIPHLKKGGYYFIEDLHAGQAEREKTIEQIKYYIETKNLDVTNVTLTPNNKLLIIEK